MGLEGVRASLEGTVLYLDWECFEVVKRTGVYLSSSKIKNTQKN